MSKNTTTAVAPRAIKLGQRPKAFRAMNVDFVGPEGDPLRIPNVVFRYRTRSEFAQLLDERAEAAKAAVIPAAVDTEATVQTIFHAADSTAAQALANCITAWELESEPSVETLTELLDECPAAGAALWDAYISAARDGRLGN